MNNIFNIGDKLLDKGFVISNRYEMTDYINHGGMGIVWKAKDIILDRNVAIKIIQPHLISEDDKVIKVFTDEAKIGAKLIGHPNIVNVLDLGNFVLNSKVIYFICMEFIEGVSLDQWISNCSKLINIDHETIFRINLFIALHVLNSISFAHRCNILHRDIKPHNIFISKYGFSKVGDFGLSRFIDALTRTHTVWNAKSPAYAAPEQWNDDKPNKCTDIYQLGCTLYQLFTNRLPFEKESLTGLMKAHLDESPEPANKLQSAIPQKISDVIMKCLEKNENDRPELWEILDEFTEELRCVHEMTIDVSTESSEVQELVNEITEFDLETLKAEAMQIDFPDYHEIFSESIELILSNVSNFKISKVRK